MPQFMATVRKCGDVFRIQALVFGTMVMLHGPAALKWAVRSDSTARAFFPSHWKALLGRHFISFTDGATHRRLRAVLSAAFTPAALDASLPMIQRDAHDFAAGLAKLTQQHAVDAFPPTKQFALSVALRVILGADVREDPRLATMQADFTAWFAGLGTLFPVAVPGTPYAHALAARQRIVRVLTAFVEERQAERAECARQGAPPPVHTDTLGWLLAARGEDGEPLSQEETVDSLLGFIFAGHDTTTAMICSCLYILGRVATPEHVRLLRAEVEGAFSRGADLERSALMELPYLDAFVKEVMRHYGPIRQIPRILTQDAELTCPFRSAPVANGTASNPACTYSLPAGTRLLLDFTNSAQQEEWYAAPLEFEPARFLPGREEDKKTPYTYVPWGVGKRMCLGQPLAKLEIKTMLAILVREYDVSVTAFQHIRFPINFARPTVTLKRRQGL